MEVHPENAAEMDLIQFRQVSKAHPEHSDNNDARLSLQHTLVHIEDSSSLKYMDGRKLVWMEQMCNK